MMMGYLKLKKAMTLTLALLLTLSLAAGCSSSTDSSDGTPTPPDAGAEAGDSGGDGESPAPSGDAIQIEYLQNKREAVDTWNVLIDRFNDSQDQYFVIQNNVADFDQVLAARMASDDMPDIINRYPHSANFISEKNEGWFNPITDWECLDNVIDTYLEAITYDGEIYTLPYCLSFMAVYYNVDKFNEAGYEVPNTWDEMMTIAEDITAKGDIAFMMPNKDSWTMQQLYANILSKDTGSFYDEIKDGAKWTDDFYVRSMDKIRQLNEYSQGDTLSWGYDQICSDFANGTGYMFLQGSWAYPSLIASNPDANIEVFPTPNDNGDMKQMVWIDISLISSRNNKGQEYVDGVREFFNFVSQTENAQTFSDLDRTPSPIKGVNADLPHATRVLDLIASNSALDTSFNYPGFAFSDFIQRIVEEDAQTVNEYAQGLWETAAADFGEPVA